MRSSLAGTCAVTAIALAAAAASLRAADGHAVVGVAEQVPGLALVAAGLVLAARFRDRHDPQLLVAAGLVWLVGNFALQDELSTLAGSTRLTLDMPRFILIWIVLGLPGGVVRHRLDRGLVVAGALVSCLLVPLALALSAPDGNPVRIDAPDLEGVIVALADLGAGLLAVTVAIRAVRKYAAESAPGRRILGPVLLVGLVTAIVDGVSVVTTASSDVDVTVYGSGDLAVDISAIAILVAWTALALVFFVAVGRSRSSAGAVGRLLPDLSGDASEQQLQAMLSRAVGDPTLVLELNPGPSGDQVRTPHRATTEVVFGEHTLARLHHDHALLEHPAALEAATAALGLLLGRRRLTQALDDTARRSSADRVRLESDLARVRDAFGAFVDPTVAASAIEGGWEVGGYEVEVTVMFLDVRGFTAWAERSTPGEVVSRMNSLWELVVPIVLANEGHANKFIGDGLLAVFGAPRPCADHADRALAAAGTIVKEVAVRFAGTLEVGIGLHSGDVMAGTIGGGGRVEFTVIGDVVNTAARIESATRLTRDAILLSEATRIRLTTAAADRFVSRPGIELKGKRTPLTLYTPAPTADPVALSVP